MWFSFKILSLLSLSIKSFIFGPLLFGSTKGEKSLADTIGLPPPQPFPTFFLAYQLIRLSMGQKLNWRPGGTQVSCAGLPISPSKNKVIESWKCIIIYISCGCCGSCKTCPQILCLPFERQGLQARLERQAEKMSLWIF